QLFLQPKLVEHVVVLPRQVAVARGTVHAPDPAAFAVEQRRAVLPCAADEVEIRAGERLFHHLAHMAAQGFIAVQVEMPGIQVGFHMVVAAGGVVLYQARRVMGPGAAVDVRTHACVWGVYTRASPLPSSRPQLSLNITQEKME